MTETSKVRIAYDGVALENGSMDVRDLAPALIAFSDLVKRANRLIGNEQPVRLMLKADDIKKGSFDVNLELVYSTLEQAKLFTGMSEDVGLKALVEVLGLIYGGGKGVFWLIQQIKGKKITQINDSDPDKVIVVLNNDTRLETTAKVVNVFMDHQARKSIEAVVAPVNRQGIDSFEIRNPEKYEDKNPSLKVTKDDLGSFEAPELAKGEEEDIVNIQEMFVQIVSIVFDEKQKWRFSDGECVFWANVEDEEFWKGIESGALAFRSGDKLKVKCEIRQYIDPKTNNPTTERKVLKVLKIIERPTQIKLDL